MRLKKFGDNYQHLFTKGEFNNSYCLNTIDFVLKGGFIYDKLSLIKLDVFPCIIVLKIIFIANLKK